MFRFCRKQVCDEWIRDHYQFSFHEILNSRHHDVSVLTKRIRTLLFLSIFCICIPAALAQSTIFVTRHADRYGTEDDPALTPIGEKQAQSLAQLLSDANIRHIFTTELIRTKQTAAPLASLARISPVIVPQKDFDELIEKVRAALRTDESILIVGHRASVPRIVHALTGKDIAPLGSGEYGRLIAISMFPDGRTSVVTLRYAARPAR